LAGLINVVKDPKVTDSEFPQGWLKDKRGLRDLQYLAVSGWGCSLVVQLIVNGLGNLAPVKDLDPLKLLQRRRHNLHSERHTPPPRTSNHIVTGLSKKKQAAVRSRHPHSSCMPLRF
jgi:hypothetical protein